MWMCLVPFGDSAICRLRAGCKLRIAKSVRTKLAISEDVFWFFPLHFVLKTLRLRYTVVHYRTPFFKTTNVPGMPMDPGEEQLLNRIAAGDPEALGTLFSKYLPKLKGMVAARIDPRIAARVDESDVMQEVHVEVLRRVPEYIEKREVSFYEWMRFLTKQKLAEVTRRHIGVQSRDVRRERRQPKNQTGNSSVLLTGFLAGKVNSPSSVVGKAEVRILVSQCIERLEPMDREILLLRHVEQMKTVEVAERLQISPNTCRQRHIRSLKKLRDLLVECDLSWGDIG